MKEKLSLPPEYQPVIASSKTIAESSDRRRRFDEVVKRLQEDPKYTNLKPTTYHLFGWEQLDDSESLAWLTRPENIERKFYFGWLFNRDVTFNGIVFADLKKNDIKELRVVKKGKEFHFGKYHHELLGTLGDIEYGDAFDIYNRIYSFIKGTFAVVNPKV